MFLRLESAGNPERYNREYDEYYSKHDGQLEKGPFHPALGTKDRVSLSEDTSEAAAPYLQHCHQYQGYRHHYLRNI
jgi:hypothetical protein